MNKRVCSCSSFSIRVSTQALRQIKSTWENIYCILSSGNYLPSRQPADIGYSTSVPKKEDHSTKYVCFFSFFFLFWSVTLYNSLLTAQILPEWYIVVNRSPSIFRRKFIACRLFYLLYLVITLLYLYHFYPTFQSIVMLQYRRSRSEFARVPIASSPWVGS